MGTVRLTVSGAGLHTLPVYMVDPGAAVDKIVIDLGGLHPYLTRNS